MVRMSWPLVLGVLLAACGGASPAPASAPATATVPEAAAPPTAPVVGLPSSTAFLAPGMTAPPTLGELTLRVISPEDNAVVNVPEVEVKGETAPDAVVSLDDVVTQADSSGAFSAIVPLVEGPNVIEIVASDAQGDQGFLELTQTYDPEG